MISSVVLDTARTGNFESSIMLSSIGKVRLANYERQSRQ